jgi:hypothetical protein
LVAALVGEHPRVFIIRMRDDEDKAAAGAETLEALVDSGSAAVYRKWRSKAR